MDDAVIVADRLRVVEAMNCPLNLGCASQCFEDEGASFYRVGHDAATLRRVFSVDHY